MIVFFLPIWYCISNATRLALKRYQREIYGLNLEIPEYPFPSESTDFAKEMQRKPHHPKGRGYKP